METDLKDKMMNSDLIYYKCPYCSWGGTVVREYDSGQMECPNDNCKRLMIRIEHQPHAQALFEQNAGATLDRVKSTFCQRGDEYGDTWRHAQWLAMKATGKVFGITLTDEQWRALAAGCLVDVKYWRLMGGYKDDTGVDGIAYGANWVEIMRQFEKSNVPQK